jgi:methionyl-tRNA synthetase
VIEKDRPAAARTVYTALRAIDSLKTLFAPFLPFSAERVHGFLGYDRPLFGRSRVETYTDEDWEHEALVYDPAEATGRWAPSSLEAGRQLQPSAPLFRKLEPEVAEEEVRRLKETSRG